MFLLSRFFNGHEISRRDIFRPGFVVFQNGNITWMGAGNAGGINVLVCEKVPNEIFAGKHGIFTNEWIFLKKKKRNKEDKEGKKKWEQQGSKLAPRVFITSAIYFATRYSD